MSTVHMNIDGKLKNRLPFKNKNGIGVRWLYADNRSSATRVFNGAGRRSGLVTICDQTRYNAHVIVQHNCASSRRSH